MVIEIRCDFSELYLTLISMTFSAHNIKDLSTFN
jgi:hypothetical protein